MDFHGITFDKRDRTYSISERDGTTKIRLRELRIVLDVAKKNNLRLDMAGLKALYKRPASRWNTLLGNAENVVETVKKRWVIIPALPLIQLNAVFLSQSG